MSKLDELLKEHRVWMRGIKVDRLEGTSHDETKQQIKDLFSELVQSQPTWESSIMIDAEVLLQEIEKL